DAQNLAATRTAAQAAQAQRAQPEATRTRSAPKVVARAEPTALTFSGRNGAAELHLALPEGARVSEGVALPQVAQLVVDGVGPDARIDDRDVSSFHSPVTKITARRDPRIPGRVTIWIDLLVPCTTKLQRTREGVRWQVAEAAAW
ncbi:MAG TPA: hypothetical protein VF403_16855, partial [Kofleriaceae bacterium]